MLKKVLLSSAVFISSFILSCSHDSVTGTSSLVKAEDILLSRDVLYLASGQESEISVQAVPESADISVLIWKVCNPQVASVVNGKIKGLSCGKTQVLVSSNGINKEVSIIVRNLEKNRLRIHFRTEENTSESYKEYGIAMIGNALPEYNDEGFTYEINDTLYNFKNYFQFRSKDLYGMYAEISVQDDKDLMAGIMKSNKVFDYFSDFQLLHQVDLLACNEIWFIEGINKVFLSEPVIGLTGLKIPGEDRIVSTGENVDLQFTPVPSTVPLSNVSWQTSNQFVAEVDSNGTVTGIMPGTAVISALAGGVVAQKTVCVVPVLNNGNIRRRPKVSGNLFL